VISTSKSEVLRCTVGRLVGNTSTKNTVKKYEKLTSSTAAPPAIYGFLLVARKDNPNTSRRHCPAVVVVRRVIAISSHNHRRQRRRGRDHPIFDLQGSSCVDDPQNILTSVLFFSLQRNWIPQVAVIFICKLQCAQCTVNYRFINWFFVTCSAIDTNSYQ